MKYLPRGDIRSIFHIYFYVFHKKNQFKDANTKDANSKVGNMIMEILIIHS